MYAADETWSIRPICRSPYFGAGVGAGQQSASTTVAGIQNPKEQAEGAPVHNQTLGLLTRQPVSARPAPATVPGGSLCLAQRFAKHLPRNKRVQPVQRVTGHSILSV